MLRLCVSVLTLVQVTELNTLKKKSPADLWREDLAAFSEELAVLDLFCLPLFFSFFCFISNQCTLLVM